MNNILDVQKAFSTKRLELSDKRLVSLCVDTRYLVSKLIDLATDTNDIESARTFSNMVKQIQADAEVNQYLEKWGNRENE